MPTNITVTYSSKGLDPLQWIKEKEQSFQFEFQETLAGLGDITAERMGEIIRASIKRPPATGTLENSITSEVLSDVSGVEIGIGIISKMTAEAPYWALINDGGKVPPVAVGFFGEGNPPRKGASGEKWTDDPGKFEMTPQKPIDPVKYIEIANDELTKHIKAEINRLMK